MHKLLRTATLAVASSVAAAGASGATPSHGGCPPGHLQRTVAEWIADGYQFAPAMADGNGDGVVCAVALPDGYIHGALVTARDFTPSVDVIYRFGDNHRGPAQ